MRRPRIGSLSLLLGVLIVIEIMFRIVLPAAEFEEFNRVAYSPTHSNIGADPRSYLRRDSFLTSSAPDGVDAVYELNLYGFRDRVWAARSRSPRVMFVGDSFVEGYLVGAAQTIPSGFAHAAAQNGVRVEAMNFGLSGTGIKEYAQLIFDAVPLFQPQDVVLVLFANDFPRPGFDPAGLTSTPFDRSNGWVPRAVDSAIRLARQEKIAFAWHRPPVPYFPSVPNPGNPWTRLEPRYGFVEPEFAEAMKSGRLNPFLVNDINWYSKTLVLPADAQPSLFALNEFLRQNQVRLFLVYIPCRYQVTSAYHEYAKSFCAEGKRFDLTGEEYQAHAASIRGISEDLGIPFMDLTGYLREREAAGERMYLLYDGHFRGDTHFSVGQRVFDWWAAQQ